MKHAATLLCLAISSVFAIESLQERLGTLCGPDMCRLSGDQLAQAHFSGKGKSECRCVVDYTAPKVGARCEDDGLQTLVYYSLLCPPGLTCQIPAGKTKNDGLCVEATGPLKVPGPGEMCSHYKRNTVRLACGPGYTCTPSTHPSRAYCLPASQS